LLAGFDIAAYPVGGWLFRRLLDQGRKIFETLRHYDPSFISEFDPSLVQLSLFGMEAASTILVRRGIDPIAVLHKVASLCCLPTNAVDRKLLKFTTEGRADGNVTVYVKQDDGTSAYYAIRIEPRTNNAKRQTALQAPARKAL